MATLAVPFLGLVAAATYISAPAFHAKAEASQTSALVDVLELQDATGYAATAERQYTLLLMLVPKLPEDRQAAARQKYEEGLAGARVETDTTLAQLIAAYRGANLSALDPAVQAAVDDTLAEEGDLLGIRDQVDGNQIDFTGVIREYDKVISTALGVPRALADTTSDRDLAPYLNAYILLDELMAQMALEQPVGSVVLASGEPDSSTELLAAQVFSEGNTLSERAAEAVAKLDLGLTVGASGDYATILSQVAASNAAAIPAATKEKWQTVSDAARADVNEVRDTVRNATRDKATDDASAANRTALLTLGVAVLAVALSVLVAAAIARTISRPLRRLTGAAQEVRDELPGLVEQVVIPGQKPSTAFVPITVEGNDEIGQLASAFNDVNQTTIAVAREQAALRGSIAEMFVNVARRDQVLLNRQLAFLDDLERTEADPATLSNLFRLDHLATRMRRNAESLLVLAGIDSGRRVRQPMALSDVVRTASSEIELYDRVRLNLAIDPLILGHNALNAAHLVAELLENATMFSEPHTPVEVTAGYDGQFVRVTVRDHGLGMSPEEVQDANRRVGSVSATDVVGAQRLGLYVVGRLADRLGARIAFVTGRDGSGTEAIVDLPISLFAADSNTNLAPAMEQFDVTTPRPELPTAEPEPPIAVPVDLEALTDGTTTTGMPRRRSRSVEPAAPAPSATVSQAPQTGAIVLPPLVTPNLAIDLPQGEDSWTPPEDVVMTGRALPSRQRSTTPEQPQAEPLLPGTPVGAEPSDETPVLDVGARTALFSRFRTMGDLDSSIDAPENPVELAPAPDISATDISVPVDDEPAGDVWAPTFALADDAPLVTRSAVEDEPVLAPSAGVEASPSSLVDEIATAPAQTAMSAPEPAPAPAERYTPVFAPEATPAAPEPAADWLRALTDETVLSRPRSSAPADTPAVAPGSPFLPERTVSAPAPAAPDAYAPPVAEAAPAPAAFAPPTEPPAPVEKVAVPVESFAPPAPESFAPPAAADAPPADAFAAPAEPFTAVPAEGPEYAMPTGSAHAWSDASQPPAGNVADERSAEGEEIPEDLRVEALPRFEELMSDLPTRRSTREAAAPRRGLFGRRPRPAAGEAEGVPTATPAAAAPEVSAPYAPEQAQYAPPAPYASEPVASEPAVPEPAAGVPVASYVPEVPAVEQTAVMPPSIPIPVDDDTLTGPGEPGRQNQRDLQEFAVKPFSSESATDGLGPVSAAGDAFVPERWDPPVFAPEPALAPADPTFAAPVLPPAPAPAPATPADVEDARTASLPVFGSVPMDTAAHPPRFKAPRYDDAAPAHAPEDNPSAYGPPAPLTRRHARGPAQSDPWYGDDSVEARSEWTASAVLYEEMSSLMRATGDSALEHPTADTYQPVRMETGSQHLSRRPMENRDGYVDRFTARIDRDPEQLRARLAAFQSATARGRAEAQEETEAGGASGSLPDHTPQSR